MERVFCEVIGCGQRASFRLILRADIYQEDFLCWDCFQKLCWSKPAFAVCYSSLRSRPNKRAQGRSGERIGQKVG